MAECSPAKDATRLPFSVAYEQLWGGDEAAVLSELFSKIDLSAATQQPLWRGIDLPTAVRQVLSPKINLPTAVQQLL